MEFHDYGEEDDGDYEDDYDDDDVYLDDEGLRMSTEIQKTVDSVEEGMDRLRSFARETQGMFYALLSEEPDGSLLMTYKRNKPCYGELRPYGLDVNPLQAETRGKDNKPGDLPDGFPKGNILGVAVPWSVKAFDYSGIEKLTRAVASPDISPWRTVLKPDVCEILWGFAGNDDCLSGFVWHNLKSVQPSTVISFLMGTRSIGSISLTSSMLEEKGVTGPEDVLPFLSWFLAYWTYGTQKGTFTPNLPQGYELALAGADMSRFLNGQPFDLDGGLSWYDRAAYNRPNISNAFGFKHEPWMKLRGQVKPEEVLELLVDLKARPPQEKWNPQGLDPTQPVPQSNAFSNSF